MMMIPNNPRRPECVISEDMLADALDGTLTAADQAWLDQHVATCPACATMLADAQRGAAWLDVLKLTRPEPSPDLFARIIAQTSAPTSVLQTAIAQPAPAAAHLAIPTNLLTFPAHRRGARVYFEPRLLMTAAMAFFSIALTLNLTGVRLNELHASDLSPTALRHGFYQARAGAVRQYDSLRVVHVLESRVDDLRDARLSPDAAGPDLPGRGTRTQDEAPASAEPKSAPMLHREQNIAPRGAVAPLSISLGTLPQTATGETPDSGGL